MPVSFHRLQTLSHPDLNQPCKCSSQKISSCPDQKTAIETTLRSSSQASTCSYVFHLPICLLHYSALFNASNGKAVNANFIIFDLTLSGIEPLSSVSVEDTLSAKLMISFTMRRRYTDQLIECRVKDQKVSESRFGS